MKPIINLQLPEFKVQAYHNGAFKTVTPVSYTHLHVLFGISLNKRGVTPYERCNAFN